MAALNFNKASSQGDPVYNFMNFINFMNKKKAQEDNKWKMQLMRHIKHSYVLTN